MSPTDGDPTADGLRLEFTRALRELEQGMGKRLHDLRDSMSEVCARLETKIDDMAADRVLAKERVLVLRRTTKKMWDVVHALQDWKGKHDGKQEATEKDVNEQLNDLCDRLSAAETGLAKYKTEVQAMLTSIQLAIGKSRVITGIMWSVMGFAGSALGAYVVKTLLEPKTH